MSTSFIKKSLREGDTTIKSEIASAVIENHRSDGVSSAGDVHPSVRGSEISHRSQVQRKHIFRGCLGLKINILSRVAPLNERFIRRQSERERPAARSKVFPKLSTN